MGVERAVTRWYVHRQSVLSEIAIWENAINAHISGDKEASESTQADEMVDIQEQLAKAREKLLALGPCPKPMMG